MAPNPRRQDARLDALYRELPSMRCQGLCHDSCGPIQMSIRERDRIERHAGREVTCGGGATCSMLTADRRCAVYEIRPMVCRLWGLVRSLRCPYGCVPDGGFLSEADGYRFLLRAREIGGDAGPTRLASELTTALRELEKQPADVIERRAREAARLVTPKPTVDGRRGALPRTVIDSAS